MVSYSSPKEKLLRSSWHLFHLGIGGFIYKFICASVVTVSAKCGVAYDGECVCAWVVL